MRSPCHVAFRYGSHGTPKRMPAAAGKISPSGLPGHGGGCCALLMIKPLVRGMNHDHARPRFSRSGREAWAQESVLRWEIE